MLDVVQKTGSFTEKLCNLLEECGHLMSSLEN